ncbi:hypothetical protein BJY04DRAFT_182179 [Aspergillus karnatakaensis]|uniref:uncharacterized protein n=1 Tax=Aspergillus karnatakaensis TaxID=1810916 RepID=UPI003CCD5083
MEHDVEKPPACIDADDWMPLDRASGGNLSGTILACLWFPTLSRGASLAACYG